MEILEILEILETLENPGRLVAGGIFAPPTVLIFDFFFYFS